MGVHCPITKQGVQPRMVFWVSLFNLFKIISICFVVAIFDIVHDVDAIFPLP